MNTDKAKRLLKKVQALFDNLSDQGTMSALERDLLLSYLRELYEDVSSSVTTSGSTHAVPKEPVRATGEKPSLEEPVKVSSLSKEWKEPPKPITPEPVHTHIEQIVVPVHEPVVAFTHVHEPVFTKQAPSPVSSPSENDDALIALFEFKEVGELADKHKLQPIERIEHGMGINERVLTINELFSGDSDLFKKTLDYLNNLQSFSDAQDYLIEGVASRFHWADETKKNKCDYFIQLVRRKYMKVN